MRDSSKRIHFHGADMIRLLAILVVCAALIMIGVLVFRKSDRGFNCKTCRHCLKLFRDGAVCGFGDKQAFMNPTHVANCSSNLRRS